MSCLLSSEGKLYSPSSGRYSFDIHGLWCIRLLEEYSDGPQIPTYIPRAALCRSKPVYGPCGLFFVLGTKGFYWLTRAMPNNGDAVHSAAVARRIGHEAALSVWSDGEILLLTLSNDPVASDQKQDHKMDRLVHVHTE